MIFVIFPIDYTVEDECRWLRGFSMTGLMNRFFDPYLPSTNYTKAAKKACTESKVSIIYAHRLCKEPYIGIYIVMYVISQQITFHDDPLFSVVSLSLIISSIERGSKSRNFFSGIIESH